MITFRDADLVRDREFILEMHCLGNYSGEQAWFRNDNYETYRRSWMETPQPSSYLKSLDSRLKEGRAIAEVWEESGRRVGFLALGFSEIEGYDLQVAEVEDIEVHPADQRRGIGTIMLQHAEELARARGTNLLRVDIGSANEASLALHEKAGFEAFRLQYEKRLL